MHSLEFYEKCNPLLNLHKDLLALSCDNNQSLDLEYQCGRDEFVQQLENYNNE